MREVPSLISLCIEAVKKELVHGNFIRLVLTRVRYFFLAIYSLFNFLLQNLWFVWLWSFRGWHCNCRLRASLWVVRSLAFKAAPPGFAKIAIRNVCRILTENLFSNLICYWLYVSLQLNFRVLFWISEVFLFFSSFELTYKLKGSSDARRQWGILLSTMTLRLPSSLFFLLLRKLLLQIQRQIFLIFLYIPLNEWYLLLEFLGNLSMIFGNPIVITRTSIKLIAAVVPW